MMESNVVTVADPAPAARPASEKRSSSTNSILIRMAEKMGLDSKVLYNTLAKTCFKKPDGSAPTNEEMVSLLIISERAGLNPMLGEIYAFPGKQGGIVPIVGINGWRQIAAANPEYCGIKFDFSNEKIEVNGVKCNEYVRCIVRRRKPDGLIFETEGYAFFSEKFRPTDPWKSQPRQMLCNKAQIQALKNAFPSLSSIYDEEEGRDAAVSSVPAQAAPAPEPRRWDREYLRKQLDEVINIARARGQWAIANQWVMEKTSGADQEYALERLARARTEASNVEDAKIAEPAPNPESPAEKPTDKGEDLPF